MSVTPSGSRAAKGAAEAIRHRVKNAPRVGLILGSGLGGLGDAIENAARIPYKEIPGFPPSTVAGHAGELITGMLGEVPVAAMSGRFHMYEGHDAALSAFPVRVLQALGVQTLIVSNAAGGLKKTLKPGSLVLLTDHINLMGRNPLVGALQDGDIRFPDMSDAYDAGLRKIALAEARRLKIRLAQGVYMGLMGPSYETKAEVRMLAKLGGDVVGMSTVPEVIVARTIGLRVLGFSCVTNLASGLSASPITHEEVLETTAAVASTMQRLVRAIVARL